MSQLTVTALQLGLLALLWVFVVAVVGVLRNDLFGPRVLPRTAGSPARAPRRPRGRAPAPATPAQAAGAVQRPTAEAGAGAPAPGAAGASSPVPRSVVVLEGPLAGTQLPLGPSPVMIGRAPDCTLVIPDDYASGHHARLVPEGGEWVLEDLGSTNGTVLGRGAGTRVDGRVGLRVGSVVRIGRTVLELRR